MNKTTLFIFLLLPVWAFSQSASFQLKGKVSSTSDALAQASIELFNPKGEKAAATLTGADGTFAVTVPGSTFKIKISATGFMVWEKDILMDKDTDLGLVFLSESTTRLGEVSITASKKTIEQKTDRLVYHAGNNLSHAGGDALDVLATAPGVMVQNNTIGLLGKGTARVMIDGRMVELSGEELVTFLKSLAASDIKDIEIISNPPAKYDAGGEGGLLNIILKKGARDAWKNTTTASYDQNTYAFYTLRNSFNYSKGKIRFSCTGNGRLGNSKETEKLDIYYPDGLWQLRDDSKIKKDNLSGRLSLDYNISDKTTVGAQYLNDNGNPDIQSNTAISVYNTANNLDAIVLNKGLNNKHTDSQTYNAHVLSQLGSGKKIAVDIDHFTFASRFDKDFVATAYTPDMEFQEVTQSAKNQSGQNIKNTSIKADMEHSLSFLDLSYGFKASFTNSKSAVGYFNTITGTPELDPNQSNEFAYKENNQALYISGNKKWKEKWDMQLGLRLENMQTNGYSQTLGQHTENSYVKLFPTVYLSYHKNENHTFNFSYGKRINKPGFSMLNPFRSYINSNSYSEGNPFLKPSFHDNFDFTYVYKEKLRSNIFCNATTDGYGVLFTSNPDTNTQIISRGNYYKGYSYGIGENYASEITPWWESENSVYLLGSKTNFTTDIDAVPANGFQFYVATSNTFSLGKGTKLQLDYMYNSPNKSGLYTTGYASGLDIAIKQQLLGKSLQITLLANDVFNTAYLKEYTSVVNGIKQVYSENESSRFFRVSVTYMFGNSKINVKQRELGNEEEKKRAVK
ncbi:TonB-dependent receptor domain-containing protein [Flavobacterium humi]|uniref:TonB-dependent receptor n=1 Tax=Flavobacterium humi TaxID=2562683 RepID=A0A4Z0L6H6_9FLAO|nr:TonB-dependent receptor [Flavobacterium humi]TGD58116.1 TonB-dependent receptor [Flavobacterium humi]